MANFYPPLHTLQHILPTPLRLTKGLALLGALALSLLLACVPLASASPTGPPAPEQPRLVRGFHAVLGADAVVLFTPSQTTGPIISAAADQGPYYLQGAVEMLTPNMPANPALALPPGTFTGGFVEGQAWKLYVKKHPSAPYYSPVHRQPAASPTVPPYTGPLLDVQADLQVLQGSVLSNGQRITRHLPALTLSEGPLNLQLFLRLSGSYALTAVDVYLLAQTPSQPMQSLRRIPGTGSPRYETLSLTTPLESHVVLGPGREFTAGLSTAEPTAAPGALVYRVGADAPPGLYSFHAVVVEAGADPYDPARWIQLRTASVFVAP